VAVKPLYKALLEGRDPRRIPALSDWILSIPLDFYSDSAFASMYEPHYLLYGSLPASSAIKTLTILGCFMDYVGYRDVPLLDRYFALLFGGMDVSFAEVATYNISARRLVDFYYFRSGFPYLQIYT
jgi:proteasome activator subunit 4